MPLFVFRVTGLFISAHTQCTLILSSFTDFFNKYQTTSYSKAFSRISVHFVLVIFLQTALFTSASVSDFIYD